MTQPIRRRLARASVLVLLVAAPASPAWAQRTPLKPGMNLFSPAQDVELGRRVSGEAEKQLQLLDDHKVDDYLSGLGRTLAANAPGEKYPYQFRAVNDLTLNAFALPGGFLYVNRGIIEAADNEAELASVMAHEIAHAALRHGTNQASKAYIAQMPLAILGGLGGEPVARVLGRIGGGIAANSILLKYSRDAERQADLLGAQILYDSGYDPRAMTQFFEKLQALGGSRGPQWLSSHPNTENRIKDINGEIDRLGGPPAGARTDSPEFRSIRRYVGPLPKPKEVPKETAAAVPPRGTRPPAPRPDVPSSQLRAFESEFVRLAYPDNWNERRRPNIAWLAPDGGIVAAGQGDAIAFGVVLGRFAAQPARSGVLELQDATGQLIASYRLGKPDLAVVQASRQVRLGGEAALSTRLRSDSALGGAEMNWLFTVVRPDGLVYLVCVVPESEFADYRQAFESVLKSVQFQ
jgi:Zn-dependent protease with chaperone function